MNRKLFNFSILTGSLLLGTPALAEEPELQSRFLVTGQVFSSLSTGVDNPAPGSEDMAGFVYPSTNLGFRVGLGQGKWSSNPRVYLGHMADGGDFVSGYTVGFWGRSDSPSPSIDERYATAYGLSFTHYDHTEKGRLVATTFEGGARFSSDATGAITPSSGSPLGQAVVGFATQRLLMDNILIGPSLELRIGNERAPWGAQLGLRVSI